MSEGTYALQHHRYEMGCFPFPAISNVVSPDRVERPTLTRKSPHYSPDTPVTNTKERTRRCTSCHQWKDADDFFRSTNDPLLERSYECRICKSERDRQYYYQTRKPSLQAARQS